MKKIQVGMAAMTAGLVALTGCGTGSGSQSADPAPPSGQKASIVVAMWAGAQSDQDALNAQIDIARKQNPDIDIQLRTAPWTDFFTKQTTEMASGQMACVTGMNSGMLAGYVDGFDEMTDADLATAGLSKDLLSPGSLDILSYKGKTYGVPFDISAMLTYYNADMFKAAGVADPKPGWTFDDFEAAAKATTGNGKYGFGIGMGAFQWQALPIAKSGTQPVTADGTLQFDNPAFADAAAWYAGLVTDKKVAAPVASASDSGWGEEQYAAGNTAMAVDGTWNAVSYLKNESGFNAGMTTLPTGPNGSLSLILGSGYGIAKTCDNKPAALKVLGSLLSKDSQDYVASSGRSFPARMESQPLYYQSIDEKYRDMVTTVFKAAFANVQGEYVSDNWAQVDAYIQPQLASVYNGQASMTDVLKTVQQQFGTS